ncbi:hypothetical protein Nmel_004120, partial [Mimus melanotis]
SKLVKALQSKSKSPADFLNRLKETAIKYTDLDPESADGKAHLIVLFMGQATNYIRKLQKLDRVQDIDKLLEVAWKVFQDKGPSDRVRHQ